MFELRTLPRLQKQREKIRLTLVQDEFCSELRHAEILDERSDEEILDSLSKPVPVTSEKNVWAYWHSGVESMPCWNKRNVVNWIRLCGPSWAVRVLDNVPDSPNYALKWIAPEALPETFVEGTMDGPYTGQHSADFLRCVCLVKYGGVWMDVSIILVRRLEDICWRQLEDPESPYEVSLPWLSGTFIFNAFIACRKGNFFVKRW